MLNELISIIIPCYNYGQFLSETLESVFNQTYSNWECIIVDDGSSDNTEKISHFYQNRDKRFSYFKRVHEGRSAARNFGVENAKGKYIQFLDSDDLIKPEKLEKQINFMISEPSIDVLYSDFLFFNSDDGTVIETKHFTKPLKDPLREILFEFGQTGFIIPIHSALFRRDIFRNNPIFMNSIECREDWLLWIDLAINKCRFEFLDEKLVLYRKHAQSTTHKTKLTDYYRYKTAFIALQKIPDELQEEFIEQYSIRFTEMLETEREKLRYFCESKSYKFIKALSRIKKLWF